MTPDADLTLPPATTDAAATLPPGDPLTATGSAAAAVRALNADTDATLAPQASRAPVVDAPPGFVLDRELGVGGMGVVYLAHQIGLNRPVALKLVKGTRVDSKALIRFLAEAEAVAAIKHPNVVEVYQYGEHAGLPYMALEFCPGGDVTSLSKAEQTRDADWFRRVADLMAQVADGVNAAHALGIVHRDLKPHNVFLAADGTPKVADFGLAKRGMGTDLTHTQDVLGTPAYMAPEQAGKGTKFVGPEADVWALGVMLYELCCGELPIDTSGALIDTLVRVAMGEVTQLRTKLPAVPPDLALIVHKCLSLDPHDRYPTAGGLATDLRNWLEGKPITARKAGTIEQAVKWARRNKRLAVMGAAVLLTMATATGVSLGFGLDAHAQRSKADDKTAEVEREKGKVTAALDDLTTANEKTNRALAAALLGPIRPDPWPNYDLSDYERDALWSLAELRNGPVGRLFVQRATATPLTARQFHARGHHLLHAAVGLNSTDRAEAAATLAQRFHDRTMPWEFKTDLAMVVADNGYDGQGQAEAAEALLGALSEFRNVILAEWAEGLAAVAERLPSDEAERVCGKAVELLSHKFSEEPPSSWTLQKARGLVAVARRLPAERATQAYTQAAVAITAFLETESRPSELRKVAQYLAAVAQHLPADEATRLCGQAADRLLVALEKASDAGAQRELSQTLAVMAGWLPAERAQQVCGKAVDLLTTALSGVGKPLRWGEVGPGLVAVVVRLPADRRHRVLRKTVDDLLAALGGQSQPAVRRAAALELAEVVQGLPAHQAADLLLGALGKEKDTETRWGLSYGLVRVSPQLPPERAAQVCVLATDELTVATRTAGIDTARMMWACRLALAVEKLSDDRAAQVSGTVIEVLSPALGTYSFAAYSLSEGWATAVCGLSASGSRYRKHAVEFAALTGVPILHPADIPKPRPLPPQRLVELLKHPFCVKEARRAVLDALEFTYERKFADLWAFVAFAEKEHPELDLLTPPKRPEKK